MLGYLVFTYIIGVASVLIGAIIMLANGEYGTEDDDVRAGAKLMLFGVVAPVTVPVGVAYVLYKLVVLWVDITKDELKKYRRKNELR